MAELSPCQTPSNLFLQDHQCWYPNPIPRQNLKRCIRRWICLPLFYHECVSKCFTLGISLVTESMTFYLICCYLKRFDAFKWFYTERAITRCILLSGNPLANKNMLLERNNWVSDFVGICILAGLLFFLSSHFYHLPQASACLLSLTVPNC